jgi:hypothetical protein
MFTPPYDSPVDASSPNARVTLTHTPDGKAPKTDTSDGTDERVEGDRILKGVNGEFTQRVVVRRVDFFVVFQLLELVLGIDLFRHDDLLVGGLGVGQHGFFDGWVAHDQTIGFSLRLL